MFNALNQYDSLGAETAALDLYRMFQTAGYGSEVEGFRPDIPTDDRGPQYFGLEEDETNVWVQDQFGGWNPFKAVASVASGVVKAAGSAVNQVAKVPGISSIVAAPKAALAIASGKNVLSTLKTAAVPPQVLAAMNIARGGNVAQVVRGAAGTKINEMRQQVKTAARNAAFIPGLGTVAAAGLSAASAATEGKSLRQIAEEAAISAVPGGQGYQQAIHTAIDVARGGNVLKTVANRGLDFARSQLPSTAQQAVDIGLKVASAASRGTNLRQIAEEAAIRAVPGAQGYQEQIHTAIEVARGGNLLSPNASTSSRLQELRQAAIRRTIPGFR